MKARIYSHYIIHVFPYPQGGIAAMREGPELQKGKGFVSRILISADVIPAASTHLVELLAGNEPTARINNKRQTRQSLKILHRAEHAAD